MILLDTTPLVALCDARDSLHRTAVTHLGQLVSRNLATCESVLVEACFHLPNRAQRQRLRAVVEELDIDVLPATRHRTFYFEVLAWLIKYADHEPDWTDGCIAVLSGQDRSLEVWTYDREFLTTWRRPDGTMIPMAVSSRLPGASR